MQTLLLALQFALLSTALARYHGNYVAFTAALRPHGFPLRGWGNIGPYRHEKILVHSHIITNVGDAYSSFTGVFTAPFDGVYYFTFTNYAWVRSHKIGCALYKNEEEIVQYQEYQDAGDNEDYATVGSTLVLDKGDEVTVRLLKGRITSASRKHNVSTFTGFLLHRD